MKEERKRTRAHFEARVILKAGASEIIADANSKDISMQGMFINTSKKIPIGEICHIEVLLSGTSSKLSVNMKGEIIRQDKNGLGIKFQAIDVDSFVHLKNIIMYNASDPDVIEKEMLLSMA